MGAMFVRTGREPERNRRLCSLFNGSDLGPEKFAGIIEPGLPQGGILFMEENRENRAGNRHRSSMGAVP
jgi:hypothetical protein